MKIVSLLLVLVMLFSFAACTQDPADPVDSGSDNSGADTTPAETTEDPLSDNLPAETYNGEEIIIWLDNGSHYRYVDQEVDFVEGDVVHEAVVERNNNVKDRFDVTFNFNIDSTVSWRNQGELRQSILGGDEYDLIEGTASYQSALAVYGCYLNLANNDYINFDKDWWMSYSTDALKIGDRQYVATGYWDFPTITRTYVYFFNANMAESYQLGNLYDLVTAGDWTFDTMLEMAEKVSEDVNQDGVWDENDQYGAGSRWDFMMSQAATTGYQYTTVQEDGSIKVTGLTDQLLEIHQNIYPFITNNDAYWSAYTYGVHASYNVAKPRYDALINMFCNDQVLFTIDEMTRTSDNRLRDFGAYGILPSPKYYEGQENYGAATSAFVCAICTTTANKDLSSIILEALQAESYKVLRPAYFDTALSYKYLNDPQSIDMLTFIFNNVTCEWSYNYSSAGISPILSQCLSREANLASFFATNTDMLNAQLETFMEQVAAIPEE